MEANSTQSRSSRAGKGNVVRLWSPSLDPCSMSGTHILRYVVTRPSLTLTSCETAKTQDDPARPSLVTVPILMGLIAH